MFTKEQLFRSVIVIYLFMTKFRLAMKFGPTPLINNLSKFSWPVGDPIDWVPLSIIQCLYRFSSEDSLLQVFSS